MGIKLYNDIVFKWIFGRQGHTGPLIAFLNAVVGYEGDKSAPKFTKVRILNPYDQSEPFTNEKQGILDLRIYEEISNEWIDLEVQVIYSSDYAQRSKFYLAGMYRDQLKKYKDKNYGELKACYGIHLLVDSFFKDEADKSQWFHHYVMLNTRNYKPLLNHWHLYYAELAKFKSCFEKKHGRTIRLEQWVHFIGNIQDSSVPLNSFVKDNKGIKEVHDMLQTVTQNAKFREQYRLHEELLRVQRGEESRRQQLQKALIQERAAKEQERAAKEAALQKVEEVERRSILLMKKAGYSDKEIAQFLEDRG